MAISAGSLASGTAPNTKTSVYTVPVARAAHWTHAILVNTDSSARTINLYVKRSGSTSRRVEQKDLSIAAGARHLVDFGQTGLKLSTGDEIEIDASVASVVDYFFSGGTE